MVEHDFGVRQRRARARSSSPICGCAPPQSRPDRVDAGRNPARLPAGSDRWANLLTPRDGRNDGEVVAFRPTQTGRKVKTGGKPLGPRSLSENSVNGLLTADDVAELESALPDAKIIVK